LPDHAYALTALVVATIGIALSAAPDVATAQAGAGAERYEVTITPPKRPGSEAAPEAAGAAPAATDSAGAVTGDAAQAKVAEPEAPTSAPSAASASVATPRTAPAAPTGPPRTLQVAAFRQHERAEALRSELAESFPDVAILEIQSGGEPLYRVNVGRLPKGVELEALKKRLAAAGHPSFDVPAPAKPADD
jgi:cell division protein FtsN